MMVVLLATGLGLLLAGLLAIGFGIPVKEFSFGNTLILTGAVVACTGMMLFALWIAVRELKNIARQFGPGIPKDSRIGSTLPPGALSAALGDRAPEDGGFLFSGDRTALEHAATEPAAPPPWLDEAASRDRVRSDVAVEAAPTAKPRRNLLFSSTSRKERERAQGRTTEPSADNLGPGVPGSPTSAPALPAAESVEAPPATFDDAWPKSERARAADAPLPRRSGRAPSTVTETGPGANATDRHPPLARSQDQVQVTVLKSGVVDGMAYSLYSDGSIEAQMPEGMMRFASIDELRAHLDQRP